MKLVLYTIFKAGVSAATLVICLFAHKPAPLIAALVFCIAGDVLLALSGELNRKKKEPFFSAGVTSFGAAHVFLCFYFAGFSSFRWQTLFIALPLFSLLLLSMHTRLIRPGRYRHIITAYGILICCMLASSIFSPAFTGALLFWISDLILCFWYFHPGTPFWLGGAALVTYYTALFYLALK